MKKTPRDEQDKYLLARHKHLRKCEERERQTTIKIPLDPPERDGWMKRLTLREDIAKSPYASVVWSLLPLIQHELPCSAHGKTFFTRHVKDGDRKRLKEETYEVFCRPQYIEMSDWPAIQSKLTDKQKSYFSEDLAKFKSWMGDYFRKVIVFNKPWMLVEQVIPHFNYFRYVRDEELAVEIEQLRRELYYTYDNAMKLDHLLGVRRGADHRMWNYEMEHLQKKDDRKLLDQDLEDVGF